VRGQEPSVRLVTFTFYKKVARDPSGIRLENNIDLETIINHIWWLDIYKKDKKYGKKTIPYLIYWWWLYCSLCGDASDSMPEFFYIIGLSN
jgi:hypothetical protein